MKKIVYLVEQPLDERNYDRFGIQAWVDRGWDVEIWDFTPWVHPCVWKNFIELGRKLKNFSGYFPITSKNQLKRKCLGAERIKYFIDLTGENYRLIRVKIALIQKGATRVVCATGLIPKPVCQKRSVMPKLKGVMATGTVNAIKWLANKVVRKLATPFIRPGLVVVSGEKSVPSPGHSCKILKAHNLDYDIYLKLKDLDDISTNEYAVFIDQDYCFHSDFVVEGRPFIATPEKYFPAICKGLKRVSVSLNVGFRIAAHPRSAYQTRLSDYFDGIPIECGKTAELIRTCKAVVCHDSTAIQIAVLFEKPLVFFTTDELNSSYEGKSIAAFAAEFGKSVVNIDRNLDNVDWNGELYVDSEKYSEYKKKYIKADGSPEIPFWEIVADHIESERKRS